MRNTSMLLNPTVSDVVLLTAEFQAATPPQEADGLEGVDVADDVVDVEPGVDVADDVVDVEPAELETVEDDPEVWPMLSRMLSHLLSG